MLLTSRSLPIQEGKSKSSDDDEDDLDDLDEDDSTSPQPITTTYELNDTLYAEAQLEESDSVYLWLGVRIPFPTAYRRYH